MDPLSKKQRDRQIKDIIANQINADSLQIYYANVCKANALLGQHNQTYDQYKKQIQNFLYEILKPT
jgi:hypothetical protein